MTVERSLEGVKHIRSPERPGVMVKKTQMAFVDAREHILIVDDEKRIVQIGQEMLERMGYRVTGRTSSREALETVRRQPDIFDLVITDFTMPYMNGIELARELSRLRPGMPIILYTAISKAVSAELHQAIRRVLDARLKELEGQEK